MSAYTPRDVVVAFVAAFNERQPNNMRELLSGHEDWLRSLFDLWRTEPHGFAIIDRLLSEGDWVVEEWTFARRTSPGAADHRLSRGANVYRISEGRIVDYKGYRSSAP